LIITFWNRLPFKILASDRVFFLFEAYFKIK
jgi:hypothetical protein